MVGVHFQIPLAPKRHIHERMPCEQSQHVVEETDPGPDSGLPGSVNIDLNANPSLFRDPLDHCQTMLHGVFI
jgi:hypothetical protein